MVGPRSFSSRIDRVSNLHLCFTAPLRMVNAITELMWMPFWSRGSPKNIADMLSVHFGKFENFDFSTIKKNPTPEKNGDRKLGVILGHMSANSPYLASKIFKNEVSARRGSRSEASANCCPTRFDAKIIQYRRGHVLSAILSTGVGVHPPQLPLGTASVSVTSLHARNQLRGWTAGLESCAWGRDNILRIKNKKCHKN